MKNGTTENILILYETETMVGCAHAYNNYEGHINYEAEINSMRMSDLRKSFVGGIYNSVLLYARGM